MTLSPGIKTLRDEGFSEEEILENIKRIRPDLKDGINTLSKDGFSNDEIINNISSMEFGPRKLGKRESIKAGAVEAFAGPAFLGELVGNKLSPEKPENMRLPRDTQIDLLTSKPIEEMSFAELFSLSDADEIFPDSPFGLSAKEKENVPEEVLKPFQTFLQQIPESEDETSRRLRTGTTGVVGGSVFGLPGMAAGLAGSQAGQTVREKLGEDGKVGIGGEILAFLADILFGGTAAVGVDVARGGIQAGKQVARMPAIFEEGTTALERMQAQNSIRGEKQLLDRSIKQISNEQVSNFERQAADLSRVEFSELAHTNTAPLKQAVEEAFTNQVLNEVSPIQASLEEGGRSIQTSVNEIFQESVINAERDIYTRASEAAATTRGKAPKTLEQAKSLLRDMTRVPPTAEQEVAINWLRTLINELEEVIPERQLGPSSILDAQGSPIFSARTIPERTVTRTRRGNDLVKIVQNGNQVVNYGSTSREQTHRLKPILNTLREETGAVLEKNREAANLYSQANALHGRNAEIWGTSNMKRARFTENPEKIISANKTASNLRNFKNAVQNENLGSFLERLVIQDIMEKGGYEANRGAINKLRPALSQRANRATNQLLNVKNPLSVEGGRLALRNSIIRDVTEAVTSGQRPQKALELMRTRKGYMQVRGALSGSPEARNIFRSLERLFIEDIFEAVLDRSGGIDFKKATNILKNREVRSVVNEIGGTQLVNSFENLERMSNNLQNNINLYKTPQAQGIIKDTIAGIKNAGLLGIVLHAMHVPTPVLIGLGLLKAGTAITTRATKRVMSALLRKPKAVSVLRELSNAKNVNQITKQLPRLSAQLKDIETEED